MKVQIRDPEAFRGLNPQDIAAYLRTTGWKESETKPGHSSIWLKAVGKEEAEALLPLNTDIRDFLQRMGDVVNLLAAIENRSALEILADLQESGSDVIRLRLKQSDATDGTVALLDRGVPLIENAPVLMMAAACAAVEPRPQYASRKPDAATEFVRKLRLGQSERGSYVLKIISRVPPLLEPPPTLFGEVDEPFERKAVQTLARALQAVRNAADQSLGSNTFDHFQRVVKDGVSANLCDALVKMGGPIENGSELVISWTWARSRPVDEEAAGGTSVTIPSDRLPVLAEAARHYKAATPPEAFELRGAVIGLRRDDKEGPPTGPVTIFGLVEGAQRKVQVTLNQDDHQKAIDAYNRGATVACSGELTKQGSQYVLQKLSGFTVLPEE